MMTYYILLKRTHDSSNYVAYHICKAITYLTKAAFAEDGDKFKVARTKLRQVLRCVGFVFNLPEFFNVHVLGRFVDARTLQRTLQHATSLRELLRFLSSHPLIRPNSGNIAVSVGISPQTTILS